MRRLRTPIIISIALIMARCSPDSNIGPREGLQVPSGPKFTLQETMDPCSWDCHANEATQGDNNYYCPAWCHTYPLTPLLRQRVAGALQQVRTDVTECVQMRDFVNIVVQNNNMRYYNMDYWGEYADWHFSGPGTGPDYYGRMHIYYPRSSDPRAFASTLIHEAFHGYFNNLDEDQARAWATYCTL